MNEYELFAGTTFSDLMKDVYHNSKKKSRQIDSLIQDLKPHIKNVGDATIIAPILKDYLEVSVKNDDNLVRLTAIVQRLLVTSNKTSADELGLSESERNQLLAEAQSILDESK